MGESGATARGELQGNTACGTTPSAPTNKLDVNTSEGGNYTYGSEIIAKRPPDESRASRFLLEALTGKFCRDSCTGKAAVKVSWTSGTTPSQTFHSLRIEVLVDVSSDFWTRVMRAHRSALVGVERKDNPHTGSPSAVAIVEKGTISPTPLSIYMANIDHRTILIYKKQMKKTVWRPTCSQEGSEKSPTTPPPLSAVVRASRRPSGENDTPVHR